MPVPQLDVEDVGAGAGGDDPIHQGVRIGRSRAVVAFGIRAERFGDLSVPVRLVVLAHRLCSGGSARGMR